MVKYDKTKGKTWVAVDSHSAHGKSYIRIKCPHCNSITKAYLWSLAGSGKKCTGCGAIHGSFGQSLPILK